MTLHVRLTVATGSKKNCVAAADWLGDRAISPTIYSIRRKSRHTRSKVTHSEPIWPGYIFVYLIPEQDWTYIRTRWAVQPVYSAVDHHPMTINLEDLTNNINATPTHTTHLPPLNSEVTILHGPLSGWSGTVRRHVGPLVEVQVPAFLHPALVHHTQVRQ